MSCKVRFVSQTELNGGGKSKNSSTYLVHETIHNRRGDIAAIGLDNEINALVGSTCLKRCQGQESCPEAGV